MDLYVPVGPTSSICEEMIDFLKTMISNVKKERINLIGYYSMIYIKPLLLPDQQWRKENQYDFRFLLPDMNACFFSSNKTISLFVKPTMQQYNQYDFSFSFLPTRRMLVLFLEDDKKNEIVSKKTRRTEEKYVWSTLSQLTFLDQNQTTFYRINHPITLQYNWYHQQWTVHHQVII